MTNVIDFPQITKSSDDGEWLFNLSVYGHGDDTSCFITETADQFAGMNRGAATRIMSLRLDDLSFLMKQWAEKHDATERGKPLLVVTVFEGGFVQLRSDVEMITTDEQKAWAREQIVLATTDPILNADASEPKFDAWWEKPV